MKKILVHFLLALFILSILFLIFRVLVGQLMIYGIVMFFEHLGIYLLKGGR